jgi:signal transduction histidine kinase
MSRKDWNPRKSLDAYLRLSRHERGLWMTTIAVVVLSALTIAVLTLAAAYAGVFPFRYAGMLLAGGSFFILSGFMAYLGVQRETIEQDRSNILEALETRSTKLTDVNRSLEESLSTQETFLNCVSHELKTPLTCMMGYADFLAGSPGLDRERQLAIVAQIQEEGRSLSELIDRILDISRLRAGGLPLERGIVDTTRLAHKTIRRSLTVAEARGVFVETDIPQSALVASLDSARIEEALMGLLVKAISRSERGGNVSVRVRPLGAPWVEVTVEDRGSSLSSEERSALFRPFAGVETNPQGRSGDLGLALPLVQQVVMAHGGDVHAFATEGGGLRFRMLLPRLPSDEQTVPDPEPRSREMLLDLTDLDQLPPAKTG